MLKFIYLFIVGKYLSLLFICLFFLHGLLTLIHRKFDGRKVYVDYCYFLIYIH